MKILKTLLALLFLSVAAAGNVVAPSTCAADPCTCREGLSDTGWIAVPWSHGGCYFHNTITKEDRDDPPWLITPPREARSSAVFG